jgi:hypothetical protein
MELAVGDAVPRVYSELRGHYNEQISGRSCEGTEPWAIEPQMQRRWEEFMSPVARAVDQSLRER